MLTYQLISHQHSAEPELETLSPLDNADQSQKLLDSMLSESRSKELRVTLERLSACSELVDDNCGNEKIGWMVASRMTD